MGSEISGGFFDFEEDLKLVQECTSYFECIGKRFGVEVGAESPPQFDRC